MAEKEEFEQKVTTDPEPEPKEPTLEERLEALQTKTDEATTRAEEATTRADKAEKSVQGLRGSLQEKESKLREQTGSNTRMDGIEQRMEIIALAMDKGLSTSDVDGEKLNLKQEFADLRERQAKDTAEEKSKLQNEETARVADGLWTRAQEFGTYQDNDDVAEIYDALVDNKAYKAERLIKKLEGVKPKVEETKKESDEDLKQKWIEEGKRLAAEEKGDLSTDTGGPGGSIEGDAEFKTKFGSGELPYTKANKERAEQLMKK